MAFVPEPYTDELLSSWIARIASAHFTTVRGLLSKQLPGSVFYVKDIDIFDYTNFFWEILSYSSGYSIERIYQMRMKSYEGYLQEEIAQTGRQHWIIPINETAKYGKRKQKCLRYCPLCLKEDGYFKKEWRLLYVNACLKHRCYLKTNVHNVVHLLSSLFHLKTHAIQLFSMWVSFGGARSSFNR